MSRTPNSDRCSVRGMGVAVIVSTSTVCRSALSRSFTSTPNRCSSSMIDQAQVLERDVGLRQPMRADDDVDRARRPGPR